MLTKARIVAAVLGSIVEEGEPFSIKDARDTLKIAREVVQESEQETKRLNWLLENHEAEVGYFSSGTAYIQNYTSSGEIGANGLSGVYIAKGKNHRMCIDNFLLGNIEKVE